MFNAQLRRHQLDADFSQRNYPSLKRGYIWEIRHALGMNATQLAKRLNMAPASVHDLELSEQLGSITINSLRKCADTMGCDLVYAIVPKTSLNDLVKTQALKRASEIAEGVHRTMSLEQQAVPKQLTDEMIQDKADELRLRGGRDLWS